MEDFKRLPVIFDEEISFFGSPFSQKNNYRDVKLSFHVTFRLWSGFNHFMSEDISKNNTKKIRNSKLNQFVLRFRVKWLVRSSQRTQTFPLNILTTRWLDTFPSSNSKVFLNHGVHGVTAIHGINFQLIRNFPSASRITGIAKSSSVGFSRIKIQFHTKFNHMQWLWN